MNWKVALPGLILVLALAGSIMVNNEAEITLYGRRSSSGTYLYFRNYVVNDEYVGDMYNMVGNEAIVQAVKNDKTGIGYVGIGYVLDDNGKPIDGIKILDIAKDESSEPVSPLKPQNVKTGKYPIARPLYQYTDGVPPEGSLIRDFLSFELSERGEKIVTETGFYPVTPQDREHNENLFETGKTSEADGGNNLVIKGSDTVLQLASNYAEAYMEENPEANITVEGGGSGTGIASLIEDRTDIADSSREIDPEEVKKAEKNEINPVGFVIARDCISIIVNENSSIESLTLEQVSRIFRGDVESWNEVGG